jgi:hypothetical protein
MNSVKHLSEFISDVSTRITQALSSRGVMDFYLGDSVPETQLKLFRPVFLEVLAFAASCQHGIQEEMEPIIEDTKDISEGLGLALDDFIAGRIALYAGSKNPEQSFARLCNYIGNNQKNAENLDDPEELGFQSDYQNKSEMTVQVIAAEITDKLRK